MTRVPKVEEIRIKDGDEMDGMRHSLSKAIDCDWELGWNY